MSDDIKKFEEEFDESGLDSLSLVELTLRHAVVTQVIKEAQLAKDERWRNLVSQQRKLNKVLIQKGKKEREEKGHPEPDAIVVGVRPAPIAIRRKNVSTSPNPEASVVNVMAATGKITFTCTCGLELVGVVDMNPARVTCTCGIGYTISFLLMTNKV